MKIIQRKITKYEVNVYVDLLMSKFEGWHDYDGNRIAVKGGISFNGDDAQEIIVKILSSKPDKLISTLKKLDLIPESIYHIENELSGECNSLPIYTSIQTINNEGGGSVLAEAFFGNETHLLNGRGDILYEENYHWIEMGLNNLLIVRINDDDETQIYGRAPSYEYHIINYSEKYLNDRKIAFVTENGVKYQITSLLRNYNREIIGNGDTFVLENLPIGRYSVNKFLGNDDTKTVVKKDIGEIWTESEDFLMNYFIFPSLNEYQSKYKKILDKIWDKQDSKEAIIHELLNANEEDFDNFNNFSVYPFLPLHFKKDIDILLCLFLRSMYAEARLHSGILVTNTNRYDSLILIRKDFINKFKLSLVGLKELQYNIKNDLVLWGKELRTFFNIEIPHPLTSERVIGHKQISSIKTLINNNPSRIKEQMFLFPEILCYADKDILENKDLFITGLKSDESLIDFIPEKLNDDPEIILAAANHNNALRNASDRLKSDRDFVKNMISINGAHINYAGPFRFDKEMIKCAFANSRSFDLSEDILNKFSTDKEIMLLFLRANPYNLKKIDAILRQDKEFVLTAIKECKISFESIEESLRWEKEIILAAIHNRLYGFADIFNYIFKNSLKNVPALLSHDKEIANATITIIDSENLFKVFNIWSESIKSDAELMKKAILKNYQCFEYISESLKNDKTFLLAILPQSPKCFNYLTEIMKRDPDIFGSVDIYKI